MTKRWNDCGAASGWKTDRRASESGTAARSGRNKTVFEITITEGRNRQVRRMVEALDAIVLKLVRFAIGTDSHRGLRIGKTAS